MSLPNAPTSGRWWFDWLIVVALPAIGVWAGRLIALRVEARTKAEERAAAEEAAREKTAREAEPTMARVLIEGVGEVAESWEKIFAVLSARMAAAETKAEAAELKAQQSSRDHDQCKKDWLDTQLRCTALEHRVRELEKMNGKG